MTSQVGSGTANAADLGAELGTVPDGQGALR